MLKPILTCLLLAVSLIMAIEACGCYGPGSCDLSDNLAACKIEGVCDCCPVCNTCNQLFAGCASKNTNYKAHFDPLLPNLLQLDQALENYYVVTQGHTPLWFPPCVRPDLPSGLFINTTQTGRLFLSGTPSEIIPPTNFILKAKGDIETITSLSFTIAVVDTEAASCNHDDCVYESEKCLPGNKRAYQTCNRDQSGATFWDTTQFCKKGKMCREYGDKIYCVNK